MRKKERINDIIKVRKMLEKKNVKEVCSVTYSSNRKEDFYKQH